MAFAFTEEQRLIRDQARRVFAERCESQRLRAAMDSPEGWDPGLWAEVAANQGWLGVGVAERFGGSGLGMVELAILMEESGRVLAPIPLFETLGLAIPLIDAVADDAQKAALLADLVSGLTKAAVCLTGPAGAPAPHGIALRLEPDGAAWRLGGEAAFVGYGHAADLLLVVARAPGTEGWDGISVAAVPASLAVPIECVLGLDPTRPFSRVVFDHALVDPAMLLGPAGEAGSGLRRALQVAAILLAAEQLGVAAHSLDAAVAYARQRVQFGRAIGSFQAVKHRLADMTVQVESARSAVYAAACIAQDFEDQMEEAASAARAYVTDACLACVAGAIQVHGGIGFTWEHDAHLYFKRARSAANLLGDAAHHRDIVARAMGLDHAA